MEPQTPEEVQTVLEQVAQDIVALFGDLPTAVFFDGNDEYWSPGHHLKHLAQSNRPLSRALGLPKLAIAAAGGKTTRRSRDFASVQSDYMKALAGGGRASGRYLPTLVGDGSDTQPQILADFRASVQELLQAAQGWSAGDLNRYLLPHPLLGKLTVTEMLYFAVYHHQHHLNGVRSNLGSARLEHV